MQFLDHIDAIEIRAKALGLSLRQLCLTSGLDYTRVWRWRQRRNVPTIERFEKYRSTLEARLEHLERRAARKPRRAA